jgi:MraZ protein
MASMPYIYNGPGFSLQRDKGRFVLPAAFRSTLKESSGGMTVCLGKDAVHNCLVGFGVSRKNEMAAQYHREDQTALERGDPFDAVKRGMALFGFTDITFDDSGRFVLPREVAISANIDDQLFFQGAGLFFTAWNPDEMAKMGEGWEGAKAVCASLRAAELEKAKRK